MSKPIPVAVVFSDSHLRDRVWSSRQVEGDAYFSFDQICEYAVSKGLPLIGAGDLIDKKLNESSQIVYLSNKLRQLKSAGCQMYFTQGQHELEDKPWFSIGGKAAIHLHRQQIELGGLKIYGLDYQSVEKLKEELDAVPEDTNVLICHQVWGDFMGDVCLPQGDLADISHVTTVVTGDFHETFYEEYRGKQGQVMRVFSPGSTCMQAINEPDKKYFGVLYSSGEIKKRPLLTRVFVDWPIIHTETALEEFLAGFENSYERSLQVAVDNKYPDSLVAPIYRITFSYRVSDLTRRINKLVDGRAHLFYKELPPEKAESDILAKVQELVPDFRKGDSLTLQAVLPQVIKKTEDPDAFNLAQRLLDGADPKLELARWKRELLNDGTETGGPGDEAG